LEYIKNLYGDNLKYYFEDDSKIYIDDKILNLSIIYVLLYGETWYMKHINAVPVSNDFLQNLIKINNYLINTKDKFSKFFQNMNINNNNNNNEDYISNNLFNTIKYKLNQNITKKIFLKNIKKIYNESNNSREFLSYLYKQYGMIIFTIIDYFEYYKYITYILKSSLNFNSFMQIPTDIVNNIHLIKS
jgi:hypothetical protein